MSIFLFKKISVTVSLKIFYKIAEYITENILLFLKIAH